MPEPTDAAEPLDGDSKDGATSFLESLGLSKVSQSPRHAVAGPAQAAPPLLRSGRQRHPLCQRSPALAQLGRPRARACTDGCATRLALPTLGLRYWRLCVNGYTAG